MQQSLLTGCMYTHTNPHLLVQSLTETIQHRHVMTKHNDLPTTLQHIQDIVLHCGQLHLACHIKQGKEGGSSVKLLCMGNEWWVDLVHTNMHLKFLQTIIFTKGPKCGKLSSYTQYTV